jgi:single-strand DNA-binding protein
MNKTIYTGRLTADPDVRYKDDMCIARYTLAVDRIKRDEADFIRCVAFGKNGEFAEKYLRKGMKIGVIGRTQTGSYKDKDGKTVYTNDNVVESQEFCESKGTKKDSQPNDSGMDGFMNIPDGIDDAELPFA